MFALQRVIKKYKRGKSKFAPIELRYTLSTYIVDILFTTPGTKIAIITPHIHTARRQYPNNVLFNYSMDCVSKNYSMDLLLLLLIIFFWSTQKL
jgi:hypothetical protein